MSEQLVTGHSTSSSSSKYEMQRTGGLMGLPVELQADIFRHMPNLKTAVALRLCCRQLNEVYLANEPSITAALRELLVAPFREYYSLLQRLKFPADSVKTPPALGWPAMTTAACAVLGKTPFAIDVLRHLPYISNSHRHFDITNLDYRCDAVDYSDLDPEELPRKDVEEAWADELQGEQGPEDGDRISNFKHVVMVANTVHTGGVVLLLDTFSGKIFEQFVICGSGVRLPVGEYFASRMERIRKLQLIFINWMDPQDMDDAGIDLEVEYDPGPKDSEGEPASDRDTKELVGWVRHLYRKFGWPGSDYKKEECMKAIADFTSRSPIWRKCMRETDGCINCRKDD
ncbi:unnamed protein product [Clonostachys byssicola]|uniref:F-box domain-containing protein n=1 Tax=Clonostachys byssicola TaxID=160290 RepID=A0A9N9U704_9HYPO|nr:unnamed protein product [Clonostachys byssicola]